MLKRPPVWRQLGLQDGGPQKCTGLIFYKSYLARIKSQLNFSLQMARKERAGQPNKNHASLLYRLFLASPLTKISNPPPKKNHTISKELGDRAGTAYKNEMSAGKERNVVRERSKQGCRSIWLNYRWCRCKVSIMPVSWKNQLNYTLTRRALGFKLLNQVIRQGRDDTSFFFHFL